MKGLGEANDNIKIAYIEDRSYNKTFVYFKQSN